METKKINERLPDEITRVARELQIKVRAEVAHHTIETRVISVDDMVGIAVIVEEDENVIGINNLQNIVEEFQSKYPRLKFFETYDDASEQTAIIILKTKNTHN